MKADHANSTKMEKRKQTTVTLPEAFATACVRCMNLTHVLICERAYANFKD